MFRKIQIIRAKICYGFFLYSNYTDPYFIALAFVFLFSSYGTCRHFFFGQRCRNSKRESREGVFGEGLAVMETGRERQIQRHWIGRESTIDRNSGFFGPYWKSLLTKLWILVEKSS